MRTCCSFFGTFAILHSPFLSFSNSLSTHTHTRNIYMHGIAQCVRYSYTTNFLFLTREKLPLSLSLPFTFKMFLFLIPIHSTSYTYFLSTPLSLCLSFFFFNPGPCSRMHAYMCFYARSRAPVTLCATLCAPSEPHYPRVKVSLRPAARLQDEEALPSL